MKAKIVFVYQAVRVGANYRDSFPDTEYNIEVRDTYVLIKPIKAKSFHLIPFTNVKWIDMHEPSASTVSPQGSTPKVHESAKSKGKVSGVAV